MKKKFTPANFGLFLGAIFGGDKLAEIIVDFVCALEISGLCVDAKIIGWLIVIELLVIAVCVVVFLCAVINDGNGNRH